MAAVEQFSTIQRMVDRANTAAAVAFATILSVHSHRAVDDGWRGIDPVSRRHRLRQR